MASTSANSSIQNYFTNDVFLSFRGEDTRKNYVDHLYMISMFQNRIFTYRDEEIKKGERISDECRKVGHHDTSTRHSMASTSANSSIQKYFTYDVFLSFRGEDTRKNFVDHLYHALKQNRINTYRDDEEIKKGERISDELIRSIEDSRFYIIVFSKNYASSSWCLDELTKIMECQKTKEHTAYPVFYDVEPTEVRKQSGAVGEAFDKHKDKEAAGKWRDVLSEAADLAGWELKNNFDGHESQLIQEIVEKISQQLPFINLSDDGKLVGMETRVRDVVSSLEIDNVKDVRMIGLKGMGGAGKTTLARVVFEQISSRFDGSSFVENVREASNNPLCGLKSLQQQVLSNVLNKQDIMVNSVYEGKRMIKQRMGGRKVLVVLDDVDHIDQLEALAGDLNWFKPGSRVVITTREEQVLIAHEVPKNFIFPVNLLSYEEANCLFNRYAFGSMTPNKCYEELAWQVLSYAAGLPLTIRVLGSKLRGKSEIEWKDTLERLKTIPLNETLKKLELSYDSLEEDHKEIFLDVACMLKGWKKEDAIVALESCGFHAISGLKDLELKSLLTVSSFGRLGMHDHIEEMGKNIVRRLHPNKPWKHTHLWIKKEVDDILINEKGTKITRCLQVETVDPLIVMKGLRKMKGLRFLNVNDISNKYIYESRCEDLQYDSKCSLYLPDSLQYLRWYGYPFECLPEEFQANNLVGLDMKYSTMDQLWKGRKEKVLKKLKFLYLWHCKLRSLDIGLIPNLERLRLQDCDYLVELHPPAENFHLRYLELYGSELITLDLERAQKLVTLEVMSTCLTEVRMPIESHELQGIYIGRSKLRTLNLTGARNLKCLDLKNCKDLVELHMPIESYKLEIINIDCSKLRTLNLTGARNLKSLDLKNCTDLVELHMPIESYKLEIINIGCYKLRTLDLSGARDLKRLDLKNCGDLVELHFPIESHELEIISIGWSKLRTLNLKGARNLKRLDLKNCEDLVELHMPNECHQLESVQIGCSKLRSLNLMGAWNLNRLDLRNCEDLVELDMPVENNKLETIEFCCSKLGTLSLGLSPNLKRLDLHDCFNSVEILALVGCLSGRVMLKPVLARSLAELHLTARSFGICPLHPGNNLPTFRFECIYKEPLSSSAGSLKKCISSAENLKKLISFSHLCACRNLGRLSEIICVLQCLRKLTLEGSIPEVPKELDQLESLEELTLLVTNMIHLPDSICTLKHLKSLQLKSCRFLQQLPEDLGRLECLEELDLTDCTSLLNIPNSICEMNRLKRFCLIRCVRVEKLPREIGRLPCLKDMYIDGTSITDLPESFYQLKGRMLVEGMLYSNVAI